MPSSEHRAKQETPRGKQLLRGLKAKQGFWQMQSPGETKIAVQSSLRSGGGTERTSGSQLKSLKHGHPGIGQSTYRYAGDSGGQGNPASCGPCGHKELDTT